VNVKVPGRLLFLYIVYPCAWDKVNNEEMSREDFELLIWHVENKKEPGVPFLRKCFPVPVTGLEQFAEAKGKETWAERTVYKFFRYHHGHAGDCAARVGKVASVSASSVFVAIDGKSVRCLNIYGLPLNNGNDVLIHRNVICKVGGIS
jgi:hypothetical protein